MGQAEFAGCWARSGPRRAEDPKIGIANQRNSDILGIAPLLDSIRPGDPTIWKAGVRRQPKPLVNPMRSNPVKRAIKAGRTVIGSEISRLRSPDIARLYALAGFDFVFIDMEHSAYSMETVTDMIAAARTGGIVPIVRVPQADYTLISRVLDQGAQGIMVPRVNTPEQVRDIISWMRYPPDGARGFAATMAQTDFEEATIDGLMDANNHQTLCAIQIERKEALEDLDEMLSFPGVDVACLGFTDLSIDLGLPGQLDHPRMVAITERVLSLAQRHGVAAGAIGLPMDALVHWTQKGMRFISYSNEVQLLQEAATSAARRLKSAATQKP
jgi:2-keto-3-deoxy-L-rhamnonate aldolase RhmA